MASTVKLRMIDGVQIVAPDSLNLITPYVLFEQQDWFEDEIKFLRRLLQPGQQLIDIGANHGVYTLSMARTVGPTGRVWAFEPASGTASLLAESIALNGCSQVVLERMALSNTVGSAQLSLNDNSELNAVVHGQPSAGATETVPLVTLDERMERWAWQHIDFVKIDAEGEEANILKGGARFFNELSPLVQYEIKAGSQLHLDLARQFAELGYASYRLVPGLQLLVPFDRERPSDGFLLNLFCCKPDRARQLAAQGFLLQAPAAGRAPGIEPMTPDPAEPSIHAEHGWRHTLAGLPYGAMLSDTWEQTAAAAGRAEVEKALALYCASLDVRRSAAERFGALEAGFHQMAALCDQAPSHLRWASLARMAADCGARSVAVEALRKLAAVIERRQQVDTSEPFVAPAKRFDAIAPGAAGLAAWVVAAVAEELERLDSFSSFYTEAAAKPRLDLIRSLGFGSDEMVRRRNLVHRRFGLPA